MYQEVGQDVFDLLIHLFGTRRIVLSAADCAIRFVVDTLYRAAVPPSSTSTSTESTDPFVRYASNSIQH